MAADVVAAINASGKPVLAVDVPSGLDGTTGRRRRAGGAGDLHRHVLPAEARPPAAAGTRRCAARCVVADIGIPEQRAAGDRRHAPSPTGRRLWRAAYPWPRLDGHKYTRGHAVVVSGPPESTGAARLGARGALRVGAGLVTVVGVGDRDRDQRHAPDGRHGQGASANDAALAEFLRDVRRNAVLIGPAPASAPATAATVADRARLARRRRARCRCAHLVRAGRERGAGAGRPASASWCAGPSPGPAPEGLFDAIKARKAPVVLTPHEGEFKRLFGDRCRAPARSWSGPAGPPRPSGAVVILKGPDTVIAAPDGRAAINDNAPPWLATAGSGDVLAGLVTGLLAQRMPAFEAACAAVWLHGECAKRLGAGLIAEDLPEALPQVLQTLQTQR